jgi:flagella basal body P-ring formation protein FlgA
MKHFFATVPLALFALSAPLCGNDLASLLVPVAQLKAEAASREKADTPALAAKPAPAIFISREDILAGLSDALSARFSVDGKLGIDTPAVLRPIRVKDASWRVEVLRVSGTALAPRMNVIFRILCGKESQGEIQLSVTCTLMREVLVANRRVERATTASKNDYDVQVRDVLDTSAGTPVPVTQDLDQYEIKGNVGQGQILLWRDIELKPTLRRGQMVEAVADEGFMHVAIKAMALEDGRTGDVINVRNLTSNKEIQARIINERTVQVYF